MPAPSDYNDVPSRIREFREKHPEGSLRCADVSRPYSIETIGDQTFVVYIAAAFRHPEDSAPGIGAAWELVPGPTNFTKGSELQNAETSAWGRAIIAAGAADAKRVSTDEDVQRSRAANNLPPASTRSEVQSIVDRLEKLLPQPGYPPDWKEAKLPTMSTLKQVLNGDFILSVDDRDEMNRILEQVA